jgi:ATP-binding cassette subfamily B (MDR/TAP) protein 1
MVFSNFYLTFLLNLIAAILRNEIGWFDDTNNTSSMLSSRLESDATLLRTIVVDRSSILLQNVGFIITAFIIGFFLNWRISLVVIATYPLIISGQISEVSYLVLFFFSINVQYISKVLLETFSLLF